MPLALYRNILSYNYECISLNKCHVLQLTKYLGHLLSTSSYLPKWCYCSLRMILMTMVKMHAFISIAAELFLTFASRISHGDEVLSTYLLSLGMWWRVATPLLVILHSSSVHVDGRTQPRHCLWTDACSATGPKRGAYGQGHVGPVPGRGDHHCQRECWTVLHVLWLCIK